MKAILISLALTLSVSTMANPKITDTQEAISQAIADFQAMATASAQANFNGVKAWPVSGGVKVKVYVKGADSMDLSCHRHSDSEPFECH
ncbi:MAG: hypothetical protein NXH75_08760 [Halobacteriovoraceae bacterium]|jgi:hypothetical protein|nr:hypothetical protein [Halobacteriovoraceae bacterium]